MPTKEKKIYILQASSKPLRNIVETINAYSITLYKFNFFQIGFFCFNVFKCKPCCIIFKVEVYNILKYPLCRGGYTSKFCFNDFSRSRVERYISDLQSDFFKTQLLRWKHRMLFDLTFSYLFSLLRWALARHLNLILI